MLANGLLASLFEGIQHHWPAAVTMTTGPDHLSAPRKLTKSSICD